MNAINNQYCTNFKARLNIQNIERRGRNWENITKMIEEGTKNYSQGTIELKTNKKGFLKNLCFDNRYVASFDEKVGRAFAKLNDKDFADNIIEMYKDWIFKIHTIFM